MLRLWRFTVSLSPCAVPAVRHGPRIYQLPLAEWLEIWREPCSKRYRAMCRSERVRLAKLPEIVTVWRGVSHKDAVEGLSWTLRRDKAEWFARRSAHGKKPLLAKGSIIKSAVFAYFSGRKEAEIVLDPEEVQGEGIERLFSNANSYRKAS
jgi:ribosomal protein L22